jgi:hypothetical protein
MWSWEKKEDTSYKTASENIELKSRLEDAKLLAAQLQKKLDDIAEADRKLPFEFDFKAMRAFSIERNYHSDQYCTIIGYLSDETERNTDVNGYSYVTTNIKVKEWYYYCDEDNHKRLAKEFKKYVEAK